MRGFRHRYMVSSLGRVWSVPRTVKRRTGVLQAYGGTVIRPHRNDDGYAYVCLFKRGVRLQIHVAILVARAFVPNPSRKPQVNHEDWDRGNNRADNLTWVTSKENAEHRQRNPARLAWSIDDIPE